MRYNKGTNQNKTKGHNHKTNSKHIVSTIERYTWFLSV